jgi:hypothetical protein
LSLIAQRTGNGKRIIMEAIQCEAITHACTIYPHIDSSTLASEAAQSVIDVNFLCNRDTTRRNLEKWDIGVHLGNGKTSDARCHQSGPALRYRHAADVADVHAVAVTSGGSINQPVSSACVPSLWPDTDHGSQRASHRLKSDQNQHNVRGLYAVHIQRGLASVAGYPAGHATVN